MKVALGTVGTFEFAAGKATIEASQAGGAITEKVTVDAGMLIDALEQLVAKAIPATAAIDPAVFGVIKAAVVAIQ